MILNRADGRYVEMNDRKYSYFAGNNYLGLASHPAVEEAAVSAIRRYGVNFAASRQTTGTSELHLELEKRLALFKGTEAAMVFASGYMGDKMLMDALRNRYSAVFADEFAHPSILDGIPADVGTVERYRHCEPDHLESLLKKSREHRPLIITDGIFSLTGEIAPLDRLHDLAGKYNGLIIVDDAHSTGVLGEQGRGTPEYFNLNSSPLIFQSETMSKAFGVYGGFLASDRKFIGHISETSKFYAGSTALSPPLAAGALAAVNLLMTNPGLRETLIRNATLIREGIREAGLDTTPGPSPIIPVLFRSADRARELSLFLRTEGIIAPFVDYPVKTDRYIVRITASAAHTDDQISHLLFTLKTWKERHETDSN